MTPVVLHEDQGFWTGSLWGGRKGSMGSLKVRSGLGSRALGILVEQEAWDTENMWHVDFPGKWLENLYK